MANTAVVVDLEEFDRGLCNPGLPTEHGAIPLKVVVPLVTSRMEESHEFVGIGNVRRHIASFPIVAMCAGPAKVPKLSRPPVLPGANVIDFVRQPRA